MNKCQFLEAKRHKSIYSKKGKITDHRRPNGVMTGQTFLYLKTDAALYFKGNICHIILHIMKSFPLSPTNIGYYNYKLHYSTLNRKQLNVNGNIILSLQVLQSSNTKRLPTAYMI